LSSFLPLQELSWRRRDFICGEIRGTRNEISVGLLVPQKMFDGSPLMETIRKEDLGAWK